MGSLKIQAKRNFTQTSNPNPPDQPEELPPGQTDVLSFRSIMPAGFTGFSPEMDGVLKSWVLPKGLPVKK